MNRLVLTLAALLPAGTAFAQNQPAAGTPGPLAELWKRVEIRQNTNVKKDIATPAFVTFTNPHEGPNTYQIGLGSLIGLTSTTKFDVDALLDYQRNSAIDSLQDAFKSGITGEWRWLTTSATGHHQTPIVTFRADYMHDGVKKADVGQFAVGYTHLFIGAAQRDETNGLRPFIFPNLPRPFGSALEVTYFPLLELEFDRVFDAKDPAAEGRVTRALGQLSLLFAIAPEKLNAHRQGIEVSLSYAYRTDLSDTTNETDDDHPLFNFDANYFPFKGDRGDVGFGVSYVDGENPDEGFAAQKYWEFSLKVRVKR